MKPIITLLALRMGWLVSLPLMILILPQALFVKKTTIRLKEAQGASHGETEGKAPSIRLLHLGESTVAGVGVKDIQQGFTANLAYSMSQKTNQQIHWQALGVNGVCLRDLLTLIEQQPLKPCDVALVSMGVNDTTKFTSIKNWRTQINSTIAQLLTITQGPVVFTQVPAMMQFPALPAPLKYFLGLRSTILNRELKQICKQYPRVHFVASLPAITPLLMAEDGYHPNAQGYKEWAYDISPKILEHYNEHRLHETVLKQAKD